MKLQKMTHRWRLATEGGCQVVLVTTGDCEMAKATVADIINHGV